ncbi:hypothetical protein ACHAWO_002032 [Cyclotella atomus]|uniref:Uncharacterized protein n=1 Tax=Cyclotella atomus TaxID=382360 RepID=A0ABD3PQ66_9STRA
MSVPVPRHLSLRLRYDLLMKGTINDNAPWEILIPSSFFAASAICYMEPKLAPSLLFALLAFATVFISPMIAFLTKPAAEGFTITMTDAINTITNDTYSEQRDQIFNAIASLLSQSFQSTALKAALKESLVSSLTDEDLQDATLNTLQNALIKASENEGMRSAALNIIRQAFIQALNDEEFVRDLMSSIVGALVQASKEEELTCAILDVVTRAVSQALADEKFTREIRGAVKDTLQDGDIYKSGVKGIFSAAFGGVGGGGAVNSAGDVQKSLMKKYDQNHQLK